MVEGCSECSSEQIMWAVRMVCKKARFPWPLPSIMRVAKSRLTFSLYCERKALTGYLPLPAGSKSDANAADLIRACRIRGKSIIILVCGGINLDS